MSITWRKVGDKWIPDYHKTAYVTDTKTGAIACNGKSTQPFYSRADAMEWCERFL